MKKLIYLMFAFVFAASLTACSDGENAVTPDPAAQLSGTWNFSGIDALLDSKAYPASSKVVSSIGIKGIRFEGTNKLIWIDGKNVETPSKWTYNATTKELNVSYDDEPLLKEKYIVAFPTASTLTLTSPEIALKEYDSNTFEEMLMSLLMVMAFDDETTKSWPQSKQPSKFGVVMKLNKK